MEWAQKLMQVEIDPKCMHNNFHWHGLSGLEIKLVFNFGQILNSLFIMDYSSWESKYRINWNRLKKFMQVHVDVDEICMHNNFVGHA